MTYPRKVDSKDWMHGYLPSNGEAWTERWLSPTGQILVRRIKVVDGHETLVSESVLTAAESSGT